MTTERWVIVGAGSAGCVLANRLSASANRSVVLLDDGPALDTAQVPPAISGPSFFEAMAEPGRMHDGLLATKVRGQPTTLYQRGRGIGGSSIVNAMVALPGSSTLYDSWGWTDAEQAFSNVLVPRTIADVSEVGAVDRALRTLGAEPARLTRTNGKRISSASAYLAPVASRQNLRVCSDSEVHRVIVQAGRATGVQLVDDTILTADRVVVAAGAIHSPALLLRSGISTPGIGSGLQDHPSAVFTLQLRPEVSQDQRGLPIGSVLHREISGSLVQLLPMSHLGPSAEVAGFGALMAALMNPVGSEGNVTIDADGAPVIDFAFLQNQRDVDGLRTAAVLALELLEQPAFAEIVSQVYIDDQGTMVSQLIDDQAIDAWLRRCCGDYVHATSTCAMGTVVDDHFAVVGYQDLFVCDASVFPTVPDANTHLPTTMLAERFALRHAT